MCATHGIDLAGPAKLYVITHREWNTVKVGIGACTGYNSRLLQHERQGWELYRVGDYTTGAAPYDVEQAVLDRLRGAKLCPFLTKDVMPNGWSETCSTRRITAGEVWAMVEDETRHAPDAYAPRAGARPRVAVLFDAEAAAEEMRARGYEPLAPYPGRTNATWPSRCTTCGHEGRPTFNAVRREPMPLLLLQIIERRASRGRDARGRVRTTGDLPRPDHGPMALPLFLRERRHDASVLRPVRNHGVQEVSPGRRPNRPLEGRRRGAGGRARAHGDLSRKDHRPVALPLCMRDRSHGDLDRHQTRPNQVRDMLQRPRQLISTYRSVPLTTPAPR
ncbi:hypothetical protein [Streptomyces gardneri]|uniref:hypothetical protein n=1 Tax=Streptomyces gardneri TaxID=66892 RepID=UPI0037CE24C8